MRPGVDDDGTGRNVLFHNSLEHRLVTATFGKSQVVSRIQPQLVPPHMDNTGMQSLERSLPHTPRSASNERPPMRSEHAEDQKRRAEDALVRSFHGCTDHAASVDDYEFGPLSIVAIMGGGAGATGGGCGGGVVGCDSCRDSADPRL